MSRDEKFMRVALAEARKGLGQTSPNPAVGAVLVVKNRIVARGHHRRAGEAHAEIECLTNFARSVPRDAVLYVTLEPCSTAGRTAACTDSVIRAGVRSVVIGVIDPNPAHSGRGIELLRTRGVKVTSGVLENECRILNEGFNKWIIQGIPLVIGKCGMSLDGRLTRRPGESRWITTAAARAHAHDLRATVDAILIGAETLRRDNPRLTIRNLRRQHQPFRVVISRSGDLPRDAHLFTDRFANRTLVYRRTDLRDVLADLGKKSVTSVLIEGGGTVLGQALDEQLLDKIQIYVAANMTGGPVIGFSGRGAAFSGSAARLEQIQYQRIRSNIWISGYVKYPGPIRTN